MNQIQEMAEITRRMRNNGVDASDLLAKATRDGWNIDTFRTAATARMEVNPVQRGFLADVPARDFQRYSITRAITNAANMKTLDGVEGELNRELAVKTGQSANGFFVPPEILFANTGQRNYTTTPGTLGGHLIETSVAGSQFIELLRARTAVANMGAQVLILNNPVTIPRQNAAGAVNWVSGSTTSSTLSTGNLTNCTLSPKVLTSFQQYDKSLLAQGNPSIDGIVRNDIAKSIALEIDRVALTGGGSGEPTGVLATNGINTVVFGANGLALQGSTLAYPFLVSMVSEVAIDNADIGSLGYIAHSSERGKLMTTPMFASTGDPVWQPGDKVAGYAASISNQLARNLTTGTATTICTVIAFGNWSDCLIGSFNQGVTDLVTDFYTGGANGIVKIYARNWVDVTLRNNASFCAGYGVIS